MLAEFQLDWPALRIHPWQPMSEVVLVHKEGIDDVRHKKDLESGRGTSSHRLHSSIHACTKHRMDRYLSLLILVQISTQDLKNGH